MYDSSGFEHVFVGETRGADEVIHFHNWIQFYLQEKAGHVDYQGYIPTSCTDGLGRRECMTPVGLSMYLWERRLPGIHPRHQGKDCSQNTCSKRLFVCVGDIECSQYSTCRSELE